MTHHTPLLALALIAGMTLPAAADPAADDGVLIGPQPDHRVMLPVGLHKDPDATAVVPGPTLDCVAKVQVFVPWKICRAMGSRVEDGPRRYEAYPTGSPALPHGGSCAFVCPPAAKLASWSFLVPTPGYRGTVTCPVSRDLQLSVTLAEGPLAPTDGATVHWQTDFGETVYTLTDPAFMEGRPEDFERLIFEAERRLDGENACPAGQPRRP